MPITDFNSAPRLSVTPPRTVADAGATGSKSSLFGKDGFTFKDLLDVINPLQQLPIVGALYRKMTGAEISLFSRMAGGALLGGPVGAVAALIGGGIEKAVMPATMPTETPVPGAVLAGADEQPASSAAPAGTIEQRRGGWIMNAASAARPVATHHTPGVATTTGSAGGDVPDATTAAVRHAPRPRPGGWIINAAYAGLDAHPRSSEQAVDVTA